MSHSGREAQPCIVWWSQTSGERDSRAQMKIIVFGATGGTGKLILTQALAKGHSVTAFVRNPEGLPAHPQIHVVQGDLFDPAAVVDAIRGHRAVLSALGARDLKKTSVLAQAIPNIL